MRYSHAFYLVAPSKPSLVSRHNSQDTSGCASVIGPPPVFHHRRLRLFGHSDFVPFCSAMLRGRCAGCIVTLAQPAVAPVREEGRARSPARGQERSPAFLQFRRRARRLRFGSFQGYGGTHGSHSRLRPGDQRWVIEHQGRRVSSRTAADADTTWTARPNWSGGNDAIMDDEQRIHGAASGRAKPRSRHGPADRVA
jgi:hypothetical protein